MRASFIAIAMKALVEFNKTVTGSSGYDEAQLLFLRRVPQYEDWVGWREGGREGGGRGAGGAGEREREGRAIENGETAARGKRLRAQQS